LIVKDSIFYPLTELECKLLQQLQQARSEAQRRQIKRYHFASIGQGAYAKNCGPDWYRIRVGRCASYRALPRLIAPEAKRPLKNAA